MFYITATSDGCTYVAFLFGSINVLPHEVCIKGQLSITRDELIGAMDLATKVLEVEMKLYICLKQSI